MIQIPVQAKVFIITSPISTDEPLDYIIALCKKHGLDPFSGEVLVFRSDDYHQIGLLAYDGHGFQWCIKRFSEGRLEWWPDGAEVVQILPRDLQLMLWGGNPDKIKLPEMWPPHGIKKGDGGSEN